MKNLQLQWDTTMRGLSYEFWAKREEYYYGVRDDGFADSNGLAPNSYHSNYKTYKDFYIRNPKDRTKAIIDIVKTIRSSQDYIVTIILPDDNFFTKDAVELVNLITSDEKIIKSVCIIDKADLESKLIIESVYHKIIITNTHEILDLLDKTNRMYYLIQSMDKCRFVLGNRPTKLINYLSVKMATLEKYTCELTSNVHDLCLCVERIRRSLYIRQGNLAINPPMDPSGFNALMKDLLDKNIEKALKERAVTDHPSLKYTDLFDRGRIDYTLQYYYDDIMTLKISFEPIHTVDWSKKEESVEDFDPDEKLEEIRKNLILEYENLTEKDSDNYKGRSYLASMIESFSNSIKG